MSVNVAYDTELRCDSPGCKARVRYPHHWDYARKRAARDGWRYDPSYSGGDFCPEHAPAGEGER